MSLNHRLINQGHVHQFVVTRSVDGWEVREEEDAAVLKQVLRVDWHRVETDALLFRVTERVLKGEGWVDG